MRASRLCMAVGLLGALNSEAQAVPAASAALASNLLSALVVQVMASGAGANVRATGSGFGSVDLGHVSWSKPPQAEGVTYTKDQSSFTMATRIGLHVGCSASDAGRLASVSAFVQQAGSTYVILLDGVKMSLSPAVVMAAADCGSTTQHWLQLQVPVTAPAGPINPSLGFGVVLR